MPGIVLELALVFTAVFGFGLYELYTLRRDRKRDAEKRAAESAGEDVEREDRHE